MRLELFDYEAAACPAKVRWALAEEDLPWVRRRIDLTEYEHKTAQYTAMYPEGVVPAARFDGEVVTDADRIMWRIAALTGSRRLLPTGRRNDARVRHWLSTIAGFHRGYGILLYAEVFLPLQARRPAGQRKRALANIADPESRERTATIVANGLPTRLQDTALLAVQAAFEEAELALRTRRWLAGERFSMADIALFPYVNTPIHRVSDLWYRKLPHLQAWLARMCERPAYDAAILKFPYAEEVRAAVALAPGGGGFRQ